MAFSEKQIENAQNKILKDSDYFVHFYLSAHFNALYLPWINQCPISEDYLMRITAFDPILSKAIGIDFTDDEELHQTMQSLSVQFAKCFQRQLKYTFVLNITDDCLQIFNYVKIYIELFKNKQNFVRHRFKLEQVSTVEERKAESRIDLPLICNNISSLNIRILANFQTNDNESINKEVVLSDTEISGLIGQELKFLLFKRGPMSAMLEIEFKWKLNIEHLATNHLFGVHYLIGKLPSLMYLMGSDYFCFFLDIIEATLKYKTDDTIWYHLHQAVFKCLPMLQLVNYDGNIKLQDIFVSYVDQHQCLSLCPLTTDLFLQNLFTFYSMFDKCCLVKLFHLLIVHWNPDILLKKPKLLLTLAQFIIFEYNKWNKHQDELVGDEEDNIDNQQFNAEFVEKLINVKVLLERFLKKFQTKIDTDVKEFLKNSLLKLNRW